MSKTTTKPETLGIPELSASLAEAHDLTKARAKAILDSLRDEIVQALLVELGESAIDVQRLIEILQYTAIVDDIPEILAVIEPVHAGDSLKQGMSF